MSKRLVASIGGAENLATAEFIDEGKVLIQSLSVLQCISLRLLIFLSSSDPFASLRRHCNSVNKWIRAEVNFIRYGYETRNTDETIGFPRCVNVTDPGTKTDYPLWQALQLSNSTRKLALDPSASESRSAYSSMG